MKVVAFFESMDLTRLKSLFKSIVFSASIPTWVAIWVDCFGNSFEFSHMGTHSYRKSEPSANGGEEPGAMRITVP
jgi:hypothetical protein